MLSLAPVRESSDRNISIGSSPRSTIVNDILKKLSHIGIIPVVVIDDAESATPLAQALTEAGLPTMEITFRTSAAQDAVRYVAKSFPSMLLGAGTVLTVEQAKAALDCGAKYIVSPGLNRSVVEYCSEHNSTVIPGVITPTEIGAAVELGLEMLKFFPAEASGGIDYLKAVSAPFQSVKFIPTGGISETNVLMYLRLPCVAACGGSWMVKSNLIANKQFDKITKLASRAMQIVLEVRTNQLQT
jgi:2-dehydro-3-deoxyphosphogluconate aldolase/(4S)-4-hydroxy-2-oxoglutarate aldolase